MTTPTRSRPILSLLYDLVLGAAAGFSLAFFVWLMADRIGDSPTPAFWPFATAGVVGMILVVRWARSRRGARRWIHVLWIPVLVFVVLMTMIVVALRNFT